MIAVSRALAVSVAAGMLWLEPIGIAPAGAHVHAVSPGAVRGSVAVVTFEVPNESQTGSATTELTVILPDVASARSETKPGWTARLNRDATAGTVSSVTWTADPHTGIGPDQFGMFRISLKLPDVDTVRFPAIQRYADGTAVHWDQSPLPDGSEPERPAATLTLAPGPAPAPEHHPSSQHPAPSAAVEPATGAESPGEHTTNSTDNSARLLAGAALLVAALSVAVTVVRRRA